MFEKVSRSLKYESKFFFDHRHIYIYIYMDTTVDHFTPLVLRVRGTYTLTENIVSSTQGSKCWYQFSDGIHYTMQVVGIVIGFRGDRRWSGRYCVQCFGRCLIG